jgi:flagellar hook-length control protein FliK
MLATRAIAAGRPIAAPPPRGEQRGAGSGDSGDAGEFLAALDAASELTATTDAAGGPRPDGAVVHSGAARRIVGPGSSPSTSSSAVEEWSSSEAQPELSVAADAAADVMETGAESQPGAPRPGAVTPTSTSGTASHSPPPPARLSEAVLLWAMPPLSIAAPAPLLAARNALSDDASGATGDMAANAVSGGAFGAGWSERPTGDARADSADTAPPAASDAGSRFPSVSPAGWPDPDIANAASIGVLPDNGDGSAIAAQPSSGAIDATKAAQSDDALPQSSALQSGASAAATMRSAFAVVAAHPPEQHGAPTDDGSESRLGAAFASAYPDSASASPSVTASSTAAASGPEVDTAAIVDQVANRLVGALTSGRLEVVLRLNPPELGELNVRMRVDGRDITAWFESPLSPVQQALTQGMAQLQAGLANAGFNLSDAWVGGDAWRPRSSAAAVAARPARPLVDDAVQPATGASSRAPGLGVSLYV